MTTPILSSVSDVIQVTNPKFVFQHQGNEIVWMLHLLTGVKTLYVNGDLYQRDYKVWCRSGQYQIPLGDQTYELRIQQDSSALLDFKEVNAPLVATLDVEQTQLESRRYQIGGKDLAKHLGYSIVAGLLIGFSVSYYL